MAGMMAAPQIVTSGRAQLARIFVLRKLKQAEESGWSFGRLESQLFQRKFVKKYGDANIHKMLHVEVGNRLAEGKAYWTKLQPTMPGWLTGQPAVEAAAETATAAAPGAQAATAATMASGASMESMRAGGASGAAPAAAVTQVGKGASAKTLVNRYKGHPEAALAKAKARSVPKGAGASLLGGGKRVTAGANTGMMGTAMKWGLPLIALYMGGKMLDKGLIKDPMKLKGIEMEGEAQRQQIDTQLASRPTSHDMTTSFLLGLAQQEHQATMAAEFGGINVAGMQKQADQAAAAEQMEMLRQLRIQKELAQLTPSETYVGGGAR